jgi:NADPH:quinone reductase
MRGSDVTGDLNMRAWTVERLGEPTQALRLGTAPVPSPPAGKLVVRVLAAPANFPDVLLCRGTYQVKPDLPFTPGLELCGLVETLGDGVTGFSAGDRVIGSSVLPAGSFAEYAVMDAATTFPAAGSLDDAQAAALYLGYQTSWFALHRRAALRPGEWLLVHAAAGGVGSSAVQLGKAAGAQVIAVAGGPEKARFAAQLGADVVVDRLSEDFVAVVNDVTGGHGADVIYDPVGGDTYQRSTKCVAFEGRIVVIGFAGGEIQQARLNHALIKNYSILGLHWALYRTRDPLAVAACQAELTRLADDGTLRPLVSRRVGIEDIAEAVQQLADGRTVGRVAYVA